MGLKLIFLIVAIVCFVLEALGVVPARIKIGWIGMAFFAAAFLA